MEHHKSEPIGSLSKQAQMGGPVSAKEENWKVPESAHTIQVRGAQLRAEYRNFGNLPTRYK